MIAKSRTWEPKSRWPLRACVRVCVCVYADVCMTCEPKSRWPMRACVRACLCVRALGCKYDLGAKVEVANEGEADEDDPEDYEEVEEVDGRRGQRFVDNLQARLELVVLEETEGAEED